jgi:DHA3 family macrolide efflux protein-like MFS transporter
MFNLTLPLRRPRGMRAFSLIWLGQIVSGIASSITTVALPIWIFSITDSGTAVGLLETFYSLFYIITVPIAGILIDRNDRKVMMMMYDILSVIGLILLLVFQMTGKLDVWHLYVAAVLQGIGVAFYWPSYAAAITTMVSKQQYVRANGLMSLLSEMPEIFGPVLAGLLYLAIGLNGILAINLIAFAISISILLYVEVPKTPRTKEGTSSQTQFLNEAIYGIKYILRRPNLLGLQLIFFTGNLFSGIALSVAVLYPMILLRTGNDPQTLGVVQSAGAIASVLSGVALIALGTIKRPARAIILAWLVSSLLGMSLLGIGQTLVIWLIAVVINSIFDPVVNVAMDSFLQAKVPPDLQGRVFSASDFIAQLVLPVTPLVAGYLGDRIFEPAMGTGGALSNMFGWLVGTGPGSGFGVLILLCGIGGTLIGLAGYLMPSIRNIDTLMPDFQPLSALGVIRGAQAVRTRKDARQSKRITQRLTRVRTFQPPDA